jgi:hypothetical protein
MEDSSTSDNFAYSLPDASWNYFSSGLRRILFQIKVFANLEEESPVLSWFDLFPEQNKRELSPPWTKLINTNIFETVENLDVNKLQDFGFSCDDAESILRQVTHFMNRKGMPHCQ